MKNLILFFAIISFTAIKAQDVYYAPDLLYAPDEKHYTVCFDENDLRANLLMNTLKYCIKYDSKSNKPISRIEKAGDNWLVTDNINSSKVLFIPDKEIIVEIDEISGMTENMDVVSYKIYYYKTNPK